MKFRKWFKGFLGFFLAGTLLYVFFNYQGGGGTANYTSEPAADGAGMVFYSFNKENRKALEVKCSESQKEANDAILMKDVEGLIFKKGRMNKDVKVFGDQGLVENNFHNFLIKDNARLESDSFTISSASFTLKDRAELSATGLVTYDTKELKGKAKNGMGLFLNVNTLKFYNTSGTYERDGRVFNYKARTMWVIENERLMVLEKRAVIRDEQSVMRSDWLSMRFSEGMKQLVEVSSLKKSYLYDRNPETGQSREITSGIISGFYNEEGQLTGMLVQENARVLLKGEKGQTLISAAEVKMNFDGATGNPTDLDIPGRGLIESSGEKRFKVEADRNTALYNEEGELSRCKASGNVFFVARNYDGNTNLLNYDIENNKIKLSGENTNLRTKNNTFTSMDFEVDTEKETLFTNSGVKSRVVFNEANALFTVDPIFIRARRVNVDDANKTLVYKNQVNLSQGETLLEANQLEIREDSGISASKKVMLTFKNRKDERELSLKGGQMVFDFSTRQIDIVDNAIIKSGETILRAYHLVIYFNEDNDLHRIVGEDDVRFTKEDLNGSSDTVEWLFDEQEMILKGTPEASKEGSGTTTGRILKIHLESNRITILSDTATRSKTILE